MQEAKIISSVDNSAKEYLIKMFLNEQSHPVQLLREKLIKKHLPDGAGMSKSELVELLTSEEEIDAFYDEIADTDYVKQLIAAAIPIHVMVSDDDLDGAVLAAIH